MSEHTVEQYKGVLLTKKNPQNRTNGLTEWMTDGWKHFCGQYVAFLEVLAQLIASRSLYTASQVRNRLSLSRLQCKTWHLIKVFYLSDERHFVYLILIMYFNLSTEIPVVFITFFFYYYFSFNWKYCNSFYFL